MPAEAAAPAAEESRQAWVVVWACFTALAVIFGVSYSFAAFFTSLSEAFDARRADVSLVFGLSGLVYFVFGAGAGIFFFGYFLFEVPSNIILHRVGARVWIARIMITWGILSAAMMFVSSATMFYVMRFFLGVAEAGLLALYGRSL